MNKILMLGCGVVVGLATLAAALQLALTSATDSDGQRQAIANSKVPSYPPAMGGPDLLQAAVASSEIRQRVVDSPDLYAAVSMVTPGSPTVEKLAAAEALAVCAELRPKAQREGAEEVAAKELLARCSGIRRNLRHDGAMERAIGLQASAEGDASVLGQLAALAQRSVSGERWYGNDVALISDALKSGDSVLVGEAIRALQAHLDDGLPDSKLRASAFIAAAEVYMGGKTARQTQFDALVACANSKQCGYSREPALDGFDGTSVRNQREVKRLAELYRLALEGGNISASELLAIR